MTLEAPTQSPVSFDFDIYRAERREWVNSALDTYLPPDDQPPTTLHKAMRYSIFCGGKRLRPILVIAGAEVVGGDPRLALPLACAVECIHTFSLIHDDLPALDDDDLRRGYATNHKVFGEAVAILAGDALLALSFELIALCRENLSPGAVLSAVSLIARASGTLGMVGGQVDDLESEGRPDIDLAAVESIHMRKTGLLLNASLLAGATLFDPPPATLASLDRYGRQLGLAFQITDDLLDLHGDESKLGKPIGSDIRNDKATYPKLLGVDQSRKLAQQACYDAIQSLTNLGPQAEPLRAIAKYMIERES